MATSHHQLYNAILSILWTHGYFNLLMKPKQALDVLRYVIHSPNDTSYIADLARSTIHDVNKTISTIYSCVNSTILANDTNKFWSCLTTTTPAPANKGVYCANLDYNLNSLVLAILFSFAVVFLFVMSFIEKRKYRLKCCNGRPGAVVPVNLLDSYENRFGNALAFGATTSHCLTVLFGDARVVLGATLGTVINSSPGFVSIFVKMLATIIIAVGAYPLFVCLGTVHKRAGSIVGICYCLLKLILQAIKFGIFTSECVTSNTLGSAAKSTLAFQTVGELPQMLSIMILLGIFIKTLIRALRRRAERQGDAEDIYDNFQEGYMFRHVKNLVKYVPETSTAKGEENSKSRLKDKLYKWKPEFQYSTRVVCAFTVSIIALYLLTCLLLYWCWFFVDVLLITYIRSNGFEDLFKTQFPNYKSIVQTVRTHVQIWLACLYTAIILSTFKTVLVYLNMLACYRGHIMRLRRGDRSWLPQSIRTLSASPSSLVAASMKYAGFQVGYAAWGYLMFTLVMWIVLGILISLIFYPLFHGQNSPLLQLLYNVWPGLLISIIVAYSQRLAAMFIFLQQRGKIISIDNRNAFHITCYFLFFFNIFLGVFSCLLRIIKSVIVGVIFLERVQKSLLPRSFEKMDPGYFAYVGYILIEHSHANPVLCVFFYLLRQHAKATSKALNESLYGVLGSTLDATSMEDFSVPQEGNRSAVFGTSKRWRIMRNRWNLAYTLINNPSLAQYRKQNLDNDKDEEKNCKDEEAEIELATKKKDLFNNSIESTPAVCI